jgi:hypothetical protein
MEHPMKHGGRSDGSRSGKDVSDGVRVGRGTRTGDRGWGINTAGHTNLSTITYYHYSSKFNQTSFSCTKSCVTDNWNIIIHANKMQFRIISEDEYVEVFAASNCQEIYISIAKHMEDHLSCYGLPSNLVYA